MEGIGHSLRDLTGHDSEEGMERRSSCRSDQTMNVITLNRNLLDLHEKLLRVLLENEADDDLRSRVPQTFWKRRQINFKNEVQWVFCGKWPGTATSPFPTKITAVLVRVFPIRFEK